MKFTKSEKIKINMFVTVTFIILKNFEWKKNFYENVTNINK